MTCVERYLWFKQALQIRWNSKDSVDEDEFYLEVFLAILKIREQTVVVNKYRVRLNYVV